MQLVSILYYALILYSIVYGCFHSQEPIGFDKGNIKSVKGILACTVVASHLPGYVTHFLPGISFAVFGASSVGVFYLLSGYGVYYSLQNQKNYFSHFIRKRFVKILVPFVIMVVLYITLDMAVNHTSFRFYVDLLLMGYPVSNSWYVFACLLCYVCFRFSFGKKNRSFCKSIILLVSLVAVYIFLVACVLHWASWWYITVMMFPVGILIARFRNRVSGFLVKYKWPVLTAALLASVAAYFSSAFMRRVCSVSLEVRYLINEILMAWTFAALIVTVFSNCSVKNRISQFLGGISFEIYLYHGLSMTLLKPIVFGIVENPVYAEELFSMLVVLLTIAAAYIMHKVNDKVIRLILR